MLKRNIPLSPYSNIKIGGQSSYFAEFSSEEELKNIISEWREINPEMDRVIVLGGGTNILFNDEEFDGLVLKNSIDFIEKDQVNVNVGAGTKFSKLLDFCIDNSLTGLEWAGGLPGTVGGAVRGNAGAYGGETKDNVLEVKSVDLKTLETKIRNREECKFDYRDSIFKSGSVSEIIISVKFSLGKGNAQIIEDAINEKKHHREERHPLDYPNLGSTFKNISLEEVPIEIQEKYKTSIKNDPFPIFPTTKLLAEAGLVGREMGGARFSEKHPNFIINFNNAKSKDVKELINVAKKEIFNKYGIKLEEEILIV